MPCYYPLDGYKSNTPNDNGKYPVIFNGSNKKASLDEPIKLPCGQCIGCRLERSRQWAMRCVHETTLYEKNCFITLTFDDKHLPEDHSIRVEHLQVFLKALRHKYVPKNPYPKPSKKKFEKSGDPHKEKRIAFQKLHGIRFFACGEYGTNSDITTLDTIGRPHYHAILFNHDFEDKILKQEADGVKLYESEQLNKLWGKGFCTIGEANFETAAYVARYIMKKMSGNQAETKEEITKYYSWDKLDRYTGEITTYHRKPEFITMSRNKGIASDWFKKYHKDLEKDFLNIRGVNMRPPKFYDKLFEELDGDTFATIKEKRAQQIDIYDPENSAPRLRVKEKIKLKQTKTLKRIIE